MGGCSGEFQNGNLREGPPGEVAAFLHALELRGAFFQEGLCAFGFVSSGEAEVSEAIDYNSHNAELLDVDGMMNLLLKLQCVQDALNGKTVLA